MTSREIVSRAIHFRNPPRLPVTMGSTGVDDTGWAGAGAPAGWKPPAAGVDEWGCGWKKTEVQNAGQVKGHPLADIGNRYRGRIAVQGVADIQATFPTGDRRRVLEDVALLVKHWAAAAGLGWGIFFRWDVPEGEREPETGEIVPELVER